MSAGLSRVGEGTTTNTASAGNEQNGVIHAPLVRGTKATSNGDTTRNVVVSDNIKRDASQIERRVLEAFPSVQSNPAEEGHAAPLTPEQKAYQQALAKYEAALDKHNAALEQNKAIDAENKPFADKAAFFDKMRESLLKVASHGLAGDSYISKQELTDLLASSDPAQRAAAEFLLANWDAIPAPKYSDWGGGMNANEMRQWATTCGKEAESWRKQMKPHVSVPAHPGSPPPPPGAQSSSSASTGQSQQNNGTSNSDATKTPEQGNADMYPTFSQLPEFSSSATTGEGRMLDASIHLQKGLDALEQDLALAAADGNQGKMTAINNKIAKLQAGMSALMQMMKQRQEMETNMSKMFSDMAMSAIRNMR
jgi:hypothetical protein